MDKITRRSFFKLAGAAAGAWAAPQAWAGDPPGSHDPGLAGGPARGQAGGNKPRYTFFQPQEATLLEAMVARLIPKDELGPGAIEAGVPFFIDKQMAGAWGAGERLYRSGPWHEGLPTQGYQLPYTPAELFRNALRAIGQEFQKAGHSFESMAPDQQDAWLKQLQGDTRELNGVPAKTFFDSLWSMTLEGYFSDPVYGGNFDMAAWKMIGFPGAYASYYHLIDDHNLAFNQAPISLADTGHGMIHIRPDIPASVHGKGK